MAKEYDVCIIGSGPGGYAAAIRASQLGLKTAIVEKNELGGVCLNIGCIPTKALLKSAQVAEYIDHAKEYGFETGKVSTDFGAIIKRSRAAADKMSKGVQFLMKTNKIDVIKGTGVFDSASEIKILDNEKEADRIKAKHIIVATGARPRELPDLKFDGKTVIDSEGAMKLEKQPKRMVIVGAGAIGIEFAYFYHTIGTKVTIVEMQKHILPVEDAEISKELEKIYKKKGLNILTESTVEEVKKKKGGNVEVTVKTKKGEEKIETDVVLSATGVTGNVEGLGLEDLGVTIEKGSIQVDRKTYKTNVDGIYAIGDVAGPPWLAHKATHEGIRCVERIAGKNPPTINYENIPGCTYCQPQVASVGFTEEKAKEKGYKIKVGRFPFQANGKAVGSGQTEGFVKVIFDEKYGEWLGCHILGADVTDLISEAVVARDLETTGHEIIQAVHPHPTLSETVMEAVAEAYGEGIHLGSKPKK